MKVAVYPGSFNPWHAGHANVLEQALQIFDKVYVMQGLNPLKETPQEIVIATDQRVVVRQYSGLLADNIPNDTTAIIKGLRNSTDFEYEKIQQYWNEDLGISIPTVYIISDRKLVHISSSAIKMVEKFKV